MKNMRNIKRPIGLNSICDEIDAICNESAIYKYSGKKIPNYLIRLDKKSGRTTLVEYAVSMFKACGVLDFSSGMDDYISLTFDGTLKNYKKCIKTIDDAAVYANRYSGVVECDPLMLASHFNESHYALFFDSIIKWSESACLFFFVKSSCLNYAETKLINKLLDSINIKDISCCDYTNNELADIAERYLYEKGMEVIHPEETKRDIYKYICENSVKTVEGAIDAANVVVARADYSGFIPVIGCSELTDRSSPCILGSDERRMRR